MLGVNGTLTALNLSFNDIGGHWYSIKQEQVSTPEGPKAIADALLVNGGLTKISLARNELGEEGTKAICEALEQNTTLKELDISGSFSGYFSTGSSNIGGSAGGKHVAKILGVNSGLTVIDLLYNKLDAAAAKMLAEVAKQKGISLCGIQRDQTTADFSSSIQLHRMELEPPDAILLASDLSQAVACAMTEVRRAPQPRCAPFCSDFWRSLMLR
jgi:hypothetical protein